MRAFITGATGFLGSNLVEALNSEGIAARVLRRPDSKKLALEGIEHEEVIGDLLDRPEALATGMEGCEWVFHVAARIQFHPTPEELYRVNVEGTRNILEAARLVGVRRVVVTSSLSSMGVSTGREPLTETSEFNLRPEQFPYGHSKVLQEAEVHRAIDRGVDAVIVNPATVVGPRDVNRNAGEIILNAANGRLKFFPPGGSNFVASRDVVAGHLAAARVGKTGERYILGSRNLTYREVFSMACRVVGAAPPRIPIPGWAVGPLSKGVSLAKTVFGKHIPIDANQMRMSREFIYADCTKAIRDLEIPQSPLEDAFAEARRWYQRAGFLPPATNRTTERLQNVGTSD